MDESVKREVESLKRSFNDWVLFLDEDQRDTKSYVRELERRVRELESKNKY